MVMPPKILSVDAWLDEYDANNRPVPDPQENNLMLAQDPLALSWASYGVYLKNGTRWSDLGDLKASPHDIEMANQTRKYYIGQLTLQGLKGAGMSKYRADLYELLSGATPARKKHLGMLYRLPYFYVEDTGLDELQHEFANTAQPMLTVIPAPPHVKTLTPVTHILRSRRATDVDNYWWKTNNNYLVKWPVLSNNTLKSMVAGLHQRGTPVDIRAVWWVKSERQNRFNYLQPGNPELA